MKRPKRTITMEEAALKRVIFSVLADNVERMNINDRQCNDMYFEILQEFKKLFIEGKEGKIE